MKILIFNQNWFAPELREMGHEVVCVGFATHLDIVLDAPLLHVDSIIARIDGFVPDVIVVLDDSAPVTVTGLEETSIPTLFYSVDVHHHLQLHRHISHVFDYMLMAQKDYIPEFVDAGILPEWMPLWASRFVEPKAERLPRAVFVGTLNPKLNTDRVTFFKQLSERSNVVCTSGEWWDLFAQSEIVINQTVKGDLNFRVFEAMITGALLLTERSNNGLFDLFGEGQHLIAYSKGDVEEAAQKIKYYLAHPEEMHRIAKVGREEILRAHLQTHRAQRLIEILRSLKKRTKSPIKFMSAGINYVLLGLRLTTIDPSFSNRAYLRAMKAFEQALEFKEPIDEDRASMVLLAAIRYDIELRSSAGADFLERMRIAYPHVMVFQLARIRHLLNSGQVLKASELCGQVFRQEPSYVFHKAEEVVGGVLATRAE